MENFLRLGLTLILKVYRSINFYEKNLHMISPTHPTLNSSIESLENYDGLIWGGQFKYL